MVKKSLASQALFLQESRLSETSRHTDIATAGRRHVGLELHIYLTRGEVAEVKTPQRSAFSSVP